MSTIPDKTYEEVKAEYLDQINIPVQKPRTQYLLCPIGLVGSGKTTVIKPLSKKLNLIRISGDEIRKIFKEKGCGYERLLELGNEIITKFIVDGYSVAIDSDCAAKTIQESIQQTKEKFRLTVLWIHINPPEEFIINKLSNLTTNWLGSAEEMVEDYFLRKPLHQNLALDFTYVFDTSKNNVDEQINEASEVIQTKVKS